MRACNFLTQEMRQNKAPGSCFPLLGGQRTEVSVPAVPVHLSARPPPLLPPEVLCRNQNAQSQPHSRFILSHPCASVPLSLLLSAHCLSHVLAAPHSPESLLFDPTTLAAFPLSSAASHQPSFTRLLPVRPSCLLSLSPQLLFGSLEWTTGYQTRLRPMDRRTGRLVKVQSLGGLTRNSTSTMSFARRSMLTTPIRPRLTILAATTSISKSRIRSLVG